MNLLNILAELDAADKSAIRMVIVAVIVMLIGVCGAYFTTDGFAKRVIIGLAAVIAVLFVLVGFDII